MKKQTFPFRRGTERQREAAIRIVQALKSAHPALFDGSDQPVSGAEVIETLSWAIESFPAVKQTFKWWRIK